jgi:hypothetical protein
MEHLKCLRRSAEGEPERKRLGEEAGDLLRVGERFLRVGEEFLLRSGEDLLFKSEEGDEDAPES